MEKGKSAAFTPGPWRYLCGIVEAYHDGKPGTVVRGQIAQISITYKDSTPMEANGFLIAAAPDLYEALRQCRLELHYCADQLAAQGQAGHPEDSVSRALRAGESALAKARGETA